MTHDPGPILLVEDEEAHVELTVRTIRKAGNANRVDTVYDGEEALDYLFNRGKYSNRNQYPAPGLVLLDIKLPGIDGIDVLKKIKEDPELKKVPVVMLTTSEQTDDIEACYKYHANSYLTKPIGYKEFEEKIRGLVFYWMLINTPPFVER